jgi:hypothetical protein
MMYSPASAESVAVVRDRVSDARSDLLVGQGQILKNNGDIASAMLRDANNNAQFANANIERTSLAGIQEGNRNTERLAGKADTIAWNEQGMQEAGFAAQRAQNERINEAQSAMADRAAKYNAQMTSDSFGRLSAQNENSFARLSAQGENGFARELDATTQGTRQVVQSEMGVTRSLGDGFREGSAALAANYASLSAQNFGTREAISNSANRNSDQTATVLATLSAQHSNQTRDFLSATRELATQAANNAALSQLEGARNLNASQLQAAMNAKDAAIQAAMNSKEAVLQAAVNSKEGVLQASFLAKEGLLENSKWFALAEKTAMVNKLDTDSRLADVKDTVIVTSNATQSLIQVNEAARIRDALAVTVAENAFLRHRHHDFHHHDHRHRGDSPRRRPDSPPRR